MNSVGFYGNLDVVVNKMVDLLFKNNDFCKLLKYTDYNPLSQPDVSTPIPDLIYNDDVNNRRFFLHSKPPTFNINECCIVEFYFQADSPQRTSGGFFTTYTVVFNIICNINVVDIFNGNRLYSLLNIIDSTFNGKKINDISQKQIISTGARRIPFAEEWQGYSIGYQLEWNGNSGC